MDAGLPKKKSLLNRLAKNYGWPAAIIIGNKRARHAPQDDHSRYGGKFRLSTAPKKIQNIASADLTYLYNREGATAGKTVSSACGFTL